MSEGLKQRGLTEKGLKIGKYEYYSIGDVTLNQLKKHKIIPQKDYGMYGSHKPDSLLVDRRNKSIIKVILVIENKDDSKFKTRDAQRRAVQQCNTVCQLLDAEVGIATNLGAYIWFNPKQNDDSHHYEDDLGNKRGYTTIRDESGEPLIKEFVIDQKTSEEEFTKLNSRTRVSLELLETVRDSISDFGSQIKKEERVDPTDLAKQIWQQVWSVSGATPEKCLYTFMELFIFKYLSDLNILEKDDKGNDINFKHIFSLPKETAFKNYTSNVRPYLKKMFPEDKIDKTTIINGTVLNPDVPEHNSVFSKLLKKLDDFGALKNIDPNFKSRVFEEFMKKSISKKNWGRYFTPRNIIDAMIEISDIDKLEEGSEICDPACGVGGFILEPIKVKDGGLKYYYWIESDKIKSRYNFHGYDIGFEKEEQLTIILAKANMLVFLSELLRKNPTIAGEFSELLNSTFKLLNKTIIGTLSKIESDKYDLILTNPPYVTSGSSNYKEAIKNDAKLSDFYKSKFNGCRRSLFRVDHKESKTGEKGVCYYTRWHIK